ncbi:hypothetical protein HNV08_12435 [Winogradskyella eckloniae]|uniref:toxin-antitoxin system YwqK family antitoxin n=1 Tax=Winogradskyella eckloniae TaxID=1089306 RepID=UPI0015649957|nr:hypothetical protein [Winogradskyella eckloniae]NRD20856.1 hypothetical protein [Winogradskyella eckloniae]
MKNTIILLCIILGAVLNISAQQDTIYFSIDWKETVKDSAAFFRPPIKKEGDLYRIEDFYASGQPQMSALSKSENNTLFHGKVTWYNEDGTVSQSGNYVNNRLNGEFISFLNNKKLTAIYKDGYFVEGESNRGNAASRNSFYTEIKNDTILEIVYDGDIKGIRYETYSLKKGGRFLSKYYDDKGKLISELRSTRNGYQKGKAVYYYYYPMRVKQIAHYPFGQFLTESFYYRNGQVRTEFEQKPEFKKSFYTPNGDLLGRITYILDNNYLKPNNGTEFKFFYSSNKDAEGVIVSKKVYKDTKLQSEEFYYENGQLKTISTYNDGKKEQQVSYSENGEEIARMSYKDYYPITGTEIIGDKKSIYKDGELIKEINVYHNTDIVFSEKTQDKETYFDKEGRVLGILNIEYQNKFGKPLNGKRFYPGYDIDISSIETFEDGHIKEKTSFKPKVLEDKKIEIYKRTEVYKSGSYEKEREIVYYSNGSKQSEITYKSYNKIIGNFYNDKEELIGTYDYAKKDGVLYEFFYDSDEVQLMKEQDNGKLIKLKKYDYENYRSYEKVNPVLIEDIDVSCCAATYLKNGDVFSKATFKDGTPWNGTIYDFGLREMMTIKNGLREGAYKKYSYGQTQIIEEGQYANNKKEGVFKSYNYLGNVQSTETYVNDQLNGKAVYFNDKGEEVSSLIYKDNKPFEGKKTTDAGNYSKPTEETYSNGFLVERVSYDDNGKRITKFENGQEIETVAYHVDSNKMRLKYTVENMYINGDVVRYDESGKVQNKAVFKNNKLESGVVFISGSITYDNNVKYMVLSKQSDQLTIKLIGHNDETIFYAKENINAGSRANYINKLGIYLDNISPKSLY